MPSSCRAARRSCASVSAASSPSSSPSCLRVSHDSGSTQPSRYITVVAPSSIVQHVFYKIASPDATQRVWIVPLLVAMHSQGTGSPDTACCGIR